MEKVSFGKNDWLFLDHDANNVMAQHRGELPMTEDMLKRWGEVWDRRWQTFSGHAYFLIVPDPQSIFPECLPFPPVSVRPVHQLLDALKSRPISSQVIYPEAELLAEKARDHLPVYTQSDTHWTAYGAFIGYRALMDVVRRKHPNVRVLTEADIAFTRYDRIGDLGNKLSPMRSSSFARCTVTAPQSHEAFNNGMRVRGSFQLYENTDRSLARCVLFGTSYSYPMISILKESFSTVVFCHRAAIDEDIIGKVKPDVVLFEMAERFINRVPIDSLAPTHNAVVLEKLGSMSKEERAGLAEKLNQIQVEDETLACYFQQKHFELISTVQQET